MCRVNIIVLLNCRYLFWVINSAGSGVFRLDLADVTWNADVTASRVRHVVVSSVLRTVALDVINYQLFFPNETSNSMMAANLDGSDVSDIRHEHRTRYMFISVASLAHFDSFFYWSTDSPGEEGRSGVFMEDFNPDANEIHHHELLWLDVEQPRHFRSVKVWHPDNQPVPGENPCNVTTIMIFVTAVFLKLVHVHVVKDTVPTRALKASNSKLE